MSKEQMNENVKIRLEETKDRRRLHIRSYFVDLNESDYKDLVEIFSTPPQSVRTASYEDILKRKIEYYGETKAAYQFAAEEFASQFKPTPIANEEELREKYFKEVRTGTGEAFNWFLSHAHELKPTTIQNEIIGVRTEGEFTLSMRDESGFKLQESKEVTETLLDCEYYWIKCFDSEDWCIARWIEGARRFKMTNGGQIEAPYKIGKRIIRLS